jgi:integrase/recombinase XerD
MTPLRQRMLDDMSIRNLAENTKLSYVKQVASFARHFGWLPEQLGPEQIREYQRHLTNDRHLEASSVGIATAALRFLYRVTLKRDWSTDDIPMPKKPFKLPIVLSQQEVVLFLSSVADLKHRTILTTLYAAGLRISEGTHLLVTDIDSQRMMLRVEQGKFRKDRYVMLSPCLLDALRACTLAGSVGPDGARQPDLRLPSGAALRSVGVIQSP